MPSAPHSQRNSNRCPSSRSSSLLPTRAISSLAKRPTEMAARTPDARLCGEAVELMIPSSVHVPLTLLAGGRRCVLEPRRTADGGRALGERDMPESDAVHTGSLAQASELPPRTAKRRPIGPSGAAAGSRGVKSPCAEPCEFTNRCALILYGGLTAIRGKRCRRRVDEQVNPTLETSTGRGRARKRR